MAAIRVRRRGPLTVAQAEKRLQRSVTASAHACVRAYAYVCERACVFAYVCVCACACMCVRVCLCRACTCTPSAWDAPCAYAPLCRLRVHALCRFLRKDAAVHGVPNDILFPLTELHAALRRQQASSGTDA
jgi:hypothetical protein